MPLNTLFLQRTEGSIGEVLDPEHEDWRRSDKAIIDRYWNGKSAIRERGVDWNNLTEVSGLWSPFGLYFRFRCWYDTLNINPDWSRGESVYGLWERDVFELFIQPISCEDYFEIEISPLGQWMDAHILKPRADVNFSWSSQLQLSIQNQVENKVWLGVVWLPFEPMLAGTFSYYRPEEGQAWRLNLFRMAGRGSEREFLSWRPTFTAEPDFHVPTSFGNLIFLNGPR